MRATLITSITCMLAVAAAGAAEENSLINPEQILLQRINELIPRSMERLGIDLWLIFARENSLEPVLPTFGLHNTVARSAYLFSLEEGAFRKIAIAAN